LKWIYFDDSSKSFGTTTIIHKFKIHS